MDNCNVGFLKTCKPGILGELLTWKIGYLEMGQIDSFKKVLGVKPATEGVKNGVTDGAPIRKPVKTTVVKEEKNEKKGKTFAISVSESMHTEIDDVKYWAGRNGVIEQRTANSLLRLLLDLFYDAYPDARKFTGNVSR